MLLRHQSKRGFVTFSSLFVGALLAYGTPAAGQIIFDTGVMPAVGIQPHAIAVGKLTASGFDDLVVTNLSSLSTSVSVLLGNGDGTFQTQVAYATGSYPYAVVLDDFNDDGKLDIVAVNRVSSSVSLLKGNGNGTFQSQQTFAVGYSPRGVASGDFGNGRRDIAVTNGPDATVSVLLNDGLGGFATQVVYPSAGNHPEGIAAVALQPGGNLDLVVVAGTVVSVLRGKGDGTFQAAVTYPAAVGSPTGIAVADFDGDGAPDVVVANGVGNSVSIFIGNGDGTFKPRVDYPAGTSPFAVAIGDFNADGKQDVITSEAGSTTSNILVLLGNGNGTLQSQKDAATIAGSAHGIVVGHFRNDQDFAVVDNTNDVARVFLNRTLIFADPFEPPPGDCPPGMIRLANGDCGPV